MKRSRAWIRPAILAALLLALSWWLYLEHVDPRYNGRRTSEWLIALNSDDEAEVKEAEVAIFVLGQRALPQITRFFYATEPEWKGDLYDLIEEKTGLELKRVDATDMQWAGESAVDILGKRAAPMVPRLIESLSDQDFDASSRSALLAIGEAAVKSLKSELSSPKPDTQIAAIYLLTKLGQKDIVPVLNQKLNSDHAEVRAIVFVALAKFGMPQADLLALVQRLLKDKDADVRAEAVNMLGHLAESDHTLIPQFAACHIDPAMVVRERVAARVWRFCHLHDTAVDALLAGLDDTEGSIRGFSYFGLLVAVGEIPTNRMVEQRSFGLSWSDELSPLPPTKPLALWTSLDQQRIRQIRSISLGELKRPFRQPTSTHYNLTQWVFATRLLLKLGAVPQTKKDEFWDEFNSAGIRGRSGIYPFGPSYPRIPLGLNDWNRIDGLVHEIGRIDVEAGNAARQIMLERFIAPVTTNSVTTP